MGKIYYVMGKSSSGKDTIYKKLLERCSELRTIVPYTTRPIRDGEQDGVEYYFVDQRRFKEILTIRNVVYGYTLLQTMGRSIWSTIII